MSTRIDIQPTFTLPHQEPRHYDHQYTLLLSDYAYDDIDDIVYHDHSGAFELSLVTQGYGYHYVNDRIFEVSVGDVIFIDPGSKHTLSPVDSENSTHLAVFNCVFHRCFLMELEPLFPHLGEALDLLESPDDRHPLRQNRNCLNRELSDFCRPLLQHIDQLGEDPSHLHREEIHLLLAVMIMEIHRRLESLRSAPRSQEALNPLVEKAMTYLREHYGEPEFAVHSLYTQLYVSKSHLTTLFRIQTGVTPVHYLNTLRIQRACEIIRESSAYPDDLHRRVGYNAYNTFYINFRSYTGFSIREYCKALQICLPARKRGQA